MGESVSCKVVSLEKSHVTHGASIWLHPCTDRAKDFKKNNTWNLTGHTHVMYPDMQKKKKKETEIQFVVGKQC